MTERAGRRRRMIPAAASVMLALVGAIVLFMATRSSDGPPQPTADAVTSRSAPVPTVRPSAQTGAADLGPALAASVPVAIEIPSIGVRTRSFVSLALAADGSLEVPQDFSAVGWYVDGPSPGQLGPAILAGHVDSHNGPAIFYRLGALRPGARVSITRKDGSTARFTVDRIQRFAKDRFPVAEVYGNVHRAELRLITCGGSFDRRSGHYVDNVVVFAHLTA